MSESGTAADEYSSTVVAPAQIVLGLISGVVAAAILVALKSTLWPVAVLAFLAAAGIGIYLAVVRVEVEPGRITLGQGRGEREERIVYTSELVSAQAQRLSWPQCFGMGMPEASRTMRLSVRAGDALVLITRADELIAVSTTDAARALQVLTGGVPIPPSVTPPATVHPPRASASTGPAPLPTTNPRPRPRPGTNDEGSR